MRHHNSPISLTSNKKRNTNDTTDTDSDDEDFGIWIDTSGPSGGTLCEVDAETMGMVLELEDSKSTFCDVVWSEIKMITWRDMLAVVWSDLWRWFKKAIWTFGNAVLCILFITALPLCALEESSCQS